MSVGFEDHCWKDIVSPEILKTYTPYHRETFIGQRPALLAIDLYNLAYEGGAKGGGVLVHTNGLGADRPRVGPGPAAHDRDIVIEPGFTFTVKTQIDFKGTTALIGEPITVSETGARRLGYRKLEPFVTG